MLDSDLAELYRVTSKRLAEQVRRNPDRFPADFMFRLTVEERDDLVALRPDLQRIKFSRVLPQAFTEDGALMLANVLNSDVAVQVSIEIVRTFVKIREAISTHDALSKRIDALELRYAGQFKSVFDALRALMRPPPEPGRKIGFT
jgi:hypothetical protein